MAKKPTVPSLTLVGISIRGLLENLLIPFEEKNLEGAFGKQYLDYQEKVRRWI